MKFELEVVLPNEKVWFSCTILPRGSHLWEFKTQASNILGGTRVGGREGAGAVRTSAGLREGGEV